MRLTKLAFPLHETLTDHHHKSAPRLATNSASSLILISVSLGISRISEIADVRDLSTGELPILLSALAVAIVDPLQCPLHFAPEPEPDREPHFVIAGRRVPFVLDF
jgi:hypothetical protein